MAEYIDREALRKAIKENVSNIISRDKTNLYVVPKAKLGELADAIADKVPAADVVEVVRCKDCKRFVHNKEARVKYCKLELANLKVDENHFCSYGERK